MKLKIQNTFLNYNLVRNKKNQILYNTLLYMNHYLIVIYLKLIYMSWFKLQAHSSKF